MANRFITAVILTSKDPDRLAKFYRDVLEIPLEVEDHGGPKHYGCELGDLHFAIHPVRGSAVPGTGAMAFGLQVFDLEAFRGRLQKAGVATMAPELRGFALMTSAQDPDGNTIYLTQLTDKWLTWIGERRRSPDFDIIQEWNSRVPKE